MMGTGLHAPRGRGAGRDVAGTVVAVGRDGTDLRMGEAVFGMATGASPSPTAFAPDADEGHGQGQTVLTV